MSPHRMKEAKNAIKDMGERTTLVKLYLGIQRPWNIRTKNVDLRANDSWCLPEIRYRPLSQIMKPVNVSFIGAI